MEVWHEHIEGFQHDSKRLPLNHPVRIQRHDAKMWRREESKAREAGAIRMRCSCLHCGGSRSIKIANIEKHLIKYGRHPLWRTSLGGDGDSSDEEWAAAFHYSQNQFAAEKGLLVNHGGKDSPNMESTGKPQFIFPEESVPADTSPAEANLAETNPAEMSPGPTNVLPWNPAQRFPASWSPAPWNPAAAPWNPAPPNPPWNAAPWHPQGQQWGPGFAYPQQWGPPGWHPAQYFRGVEAPYPVGPVWPTGPVFGQGEEIEKGPQPACTETSSARPDMDRQGTDKEGNKSWKEQAAKFQEQGLKRHKRDRRTSSPIPQEYHVEGSTPQGFGNENPQNPTYVLNRIETKLSRMEMVIDGLETAMEGLTEKMDRMIQIVDNLQKFLPYVAERDSLATSNVQSIPHIIKESQEPEPPLPKVEGPIIEDDHRQLDLGVTYLSKFTTVRDPVHTGSDDEVPYESHGVSHEGQNVAHNISLPADWKQGKRHKITQPQHFVHIDSYTWECISVVDKENSIAPAFREGVPCFGYLLWSRNLTMKICETGTASSLYFGEMGAFC